MIKLSAPPFCDSLCTLQCEMSLTLTFIPILTDALTDILSTSIYMRKNTLLFSASWLKPDNSNAQPFQGLVTNASSSKNLSPKDCNNPEWSTTSSPFSKVLLQDISRAKHAQIRKSNSLTYQISVRLSQCSQRAVCHCIKARISPSIPTYILPLVFFCLAHKT